MQFSETSNNTGLYQDAQFLTGTDSNSFPVKDFTRLANRWYYRAVIEFWRCQDSWRFDDSNVATDSDDDAGKPVATSSLTNSTRTYALPTNALRIRRIEVKDQAGNWQVVNPLREETIASAEEEFYEIDGRPVWYLLQGDKLRLFPAPDNGVSVTLTNGLRVFFDREVDEFTSTDTTQEPGLPEPFHRILSVGAAYDFSVAKDPEKAPPFMQEVQMLLQQMCQFASSRNVDQKKQLTPRRHMYI